MGLHVSLATPADDASIRGLLRREPVGGRISISYERDPDFAIGCQATGDNVTVLVARDLDNQNVIAVACRSEREVYVNSKPLRLGYIGQLRIDRQYRGRWLLSRGYELLRRIHEQHSLPAYLAAVTHGNREALGVLIEKPRKLFPSFHQIADYCTLAIESRKTKPSSAVQAATTDDLPEIVHFLQQDGPRRQLSPVWTEQHIRTLIRNLNLRMTDFRISRRAGVITGVMAMWDQSSYKQNVVRSYAGLVKLTRPIFNVAAPLLHKPQLPRLGEQLRTAYAAFVCIKEDDPLVFCELFNATSARAAECGLDYLLLGLDTRDPLLPAARKYPHILYKSRLYLAQWPEGCDLHAQLDDRPTYVEIATL